MQNILNLLMKYFQKKKDKDESEIDFLKYAFNLVIEKLSKLNF